MSDLISNDKFKLPSFTKFRISAPTSSRSKKLTNRSVDYSQKNSQ